MQPQAPCEMSRPYYVQLHKLWKNSNGKAVMMKELHGFFCGGPEFHWEIDFLQIQIMPVARCCKWVCQIVDNTRFISNLLLGKWGEAKYRIFPAKPNPYWKWWLETDLGSYLFIFFSWVSSEFLVCFRFKCWLLTLGSCFCFFSLPFIFLDFYFFGPR